MSTTAAVLNDGAQKEELQIFDYRPEHKSHYESLNREWLEKYFSVEPLDMKYFEDPQREVLDKGGEIFFARLGKKVVGAGSILVTNEGRVELSKLAVTADAQGRGIGKALVQEAISRARARGVKKLTLITNSNLAAAVGLYQRLGFRETFRGQHPLYERGDLEMELDL